MILEQINPSYNPQSSRNYTLIKVPKHQHKQIAKSKAPFVDKEFLSLTKYISMFILSVCFPACMYFHVLCACSASGSKKGASHLLKLNFQGVESYQVGTGNQMWVLAKVAFSASIRSFYGHH